MNGVRLTLDILDTSGEHEFPAMRALSMQSADAFILVYDITDVNSFSEVRALRDQIHEIKESTAVPIVVVGNKVDLAETGARQVSTINSTYIYEAFCWIKVLKPDLILCEMNKLKQRNSKILLKAVVFVECLLPRLMFHSHQSFFIGLTTLLY